MEVAFPGEVSNRAATTDSRKARLFDTFLRQFAGIPAICRPGCQFFGSAPPPGSRLASVTGLMRAVFDSLIAYFLTPGGLVLMAALDSSLVFFLPLGIDLVVVLLSAREPDLFWLYGLLATFGSLLGAAVTFWVGRKVGEHGLERFVPERRLQRVRRQVNERGVYAIAALAIIPPPFPFKVFILTAGALGMSPWRFFPAMGAVRLVRFGTEAALASRYGEGIMRWTETPVFTAVIAGMAVLAIVGTIVSAIVIARKR
jgi:membrane protein YqaA with SNARE-associated domain